MCRLGLVVPTAYPDELHGKFIRSLEHLSGIGEAKLLISFDTDKYSAGDIRRAVGRCQDYLPVRYTTHNFRGTVPMCRLRQDISMLWPEADAWMICDDDFVFNTGKAYPRSSGVRYAECMDYMNRHSGCGGVVCKSYMGGRASRYRIHPVWGYHFWTASGLLCRRIPGITGLYEPDTRSLKATGEELVAVYARISRGYYMAVQRNNPTLHRGSDKNLAHSVRGSIHDKELVERYAVAYIRRRYRDPDWHFFTGDGALIKKMPRGVLKGYRRAGGVDIESDGHSLIQDYERGDF